MSAAPARKNPFPGLRPFTQEEDYLFFGREEQTIELLQRLSSNRFLAVVGTSGSGKSSLVRCGLLSELLGGRMLEAGASWDVAVTHPGGNPLALLADALLEADLYDRETEHALENLLATLSRSHFGLVEAVKQASVAEGTNFLLVVDQFEEIFRFHETGEWQQEAANEFVSLLLEAAAQTDVPIYIVLTMRSDFIGECGQFEGLAEKVNRGEFLIPRLTREQYKRVIDGPIKVGGGQIAPRLLQRLLNDLGQQADQLPCLQHALMRTWDVWAGKGEAEALDLDDYQRVGKMSQALSLHADEIYQSLSGDRQRALCQGMFQALTVEESNSRGIRRPQRLGRLCQILEVGADELLPIIDAYRRSGVTFLMPSPEVALTDQTIIDISHESLMRVWTRLRQWVEEETQAAGIYHRLSESADLHEQGKAGLYRDPELGIALAWREAKHPNAAWAERYRPGFAAAMAFLEASQQASVAQERAGEAARKRELEQAQQLAEARQLRLEQQQRSARGLRRMIGGLAVVALIAALACIAALFANHRANQQTENALQNEYRANQSAAEAKESQEQAHRALAAAEKSQEAARDEAYRAVFNEARALRAGREPGWRDDALADLARLAASPSPRRNLFDLRTEAVAALGTPDIHLIAQIAPPGGFTSFAFGPDSRTLVTAGRAGLNFWNVQELKHVGSTDEPAVGQEQWSSKFDRVVYLPGRRGLAVATPSQGVVFTDLSGKPASLPPITRGTHIPTALAADSAGGRIAVRWDGSGMTVHDLATGEILGEFPDSPCALSPNGQFLAYSGPQFEVLLQRIGSKDPPTSLGRHNGLIEHFAFSADGNTLGSTSWDQTAVLWDVAGRRQPVVLRGHRDTINYLAFSPDGRWVATGSTDFTTRIWDALTGQSLAVLPGSWFTTQVGWSADGACLAATTNASPIKVSLYRVTGRQIFQRLAMHQHGVQCVAANPRLDRFATGADDHLVIDWDLATTHPAKRWSSSDHKTFVTAVAYSPDGSLLANGDGNGTLLVCDAETGEIKARLEPKTHIDALAFAPSGRRIASGDQRGRVILWDLTTQQPLRQFQVGPSYVWSIAFLDEGRKLVSEVSNGRVVLFDVQSGKEEAQIKLPGGIRRFIADPARNRLVVAFNNGDLASLSTPALTPGPRLEHAHSSSIESLALSPDGRLLATGGADHRVVLRDPVTFAPLLAFPEWTAMVKDLAFTLGGRHLAYVGADSDVALWDLTPLRAGLDAAGLAWDGSAPVVVATTRPAVEGERSRSAVPIIRAPGSEELALAQIAWDRKKFASAARLYSEALSSDPKLGDDRQAQLRYRAAGAAALAAAATGADKPPQDDPARAKLRGQALDWLRAELSLCRKQLENGNPIERAAVNAELLAWQKDGNLASLRDVSALAQLPDNEHKMFTQFWADVAALVHPTPSDAPPGR